MRSQSTFSKANLSHLVCSKDMGAEHGCMIIMEYCISKVCADALVVY